MNVNDAIRRDIAPTGVLRAALNFGNRVLVGRSEDGAPKGISVDLARKLAETIEIPLELVEFERAVDVSSTAELNLWDVCFLAVDPKRADTIAFTEPYVRVAGCYLVADRTSAERSQDVISRSLAIAVVEGSAYTLHLVRQPGAERLVMTPNIESALGALDDGLVDGVAGIEQAMVQEAALRRGARVLQPPFMEIRQAMGTPQRRCLAANYLRTWMAESSLNGTVATILERHGISPTSAMKPA